MSKKQEEQMNDGAKWVMFNRFNGINTADDPEKIKDEQAADAYNVSMNNGDRISLRNKGYEKFGDLSAYGTTDPITSMHTFRRRDGVNIMMASFGTYMVYYNPSSATWEVLKDDYESGYRFGYADYTLHTDTSSYVYFGNGVDYFNRWSGNYAKLTSAVNIGDTLIELDDVSSWPYNGYITIGGKSYLYSMIGGITAGDIAAAGSGYSVDDVLTVVLAGGANGTLKVTTVDGSGGVTGVEILTAGTGYSTASGCATTVAPVGGSNCTIDITAVDSSNTVTINTTATAGLAINRGVCESVDIRTASTFPIGNIYLMANNRLFISGVITSPQAVYFSKYGDPVDFSSSSLVTGSTATASGTFNLAEGGGAVTGLGFFEEAIYAFKRSMIYKITLTDALYTLQQIKPFDGKSQTVGGVAPKCIFTGSNYTFFITPDKQIMSLERVASIDYPQNTPISINISKDIKDSNPDNAAGITFNDLAYFSLKSNSTVSENNVVYVWNINDKFWDGKITGWNANDFAVYTDGTTEDLYFGSSNSTNVYKIIEDNVDDTYDIVGTWKSKQFTFKMPQTRKIMTDIFIEGYITKSTDLTITLYLDDDGFTQSFTTTLNGEETDYLFSRGDYNTFGVNPFGVEVLGANDDFTWLTKFRVYLNKDFRLKPFYNCQIEFSSDGKNQDWEIINYGFKVGPYTNTEDRKLFKKFS